MRVADCVTLRINGSIKNFFLLEIALLLAEMLSAFLREIFVESNFFILVLNSLNIKSNGYPLLFSNYNLLLNYIIIVYMFML